MTNLTSPIGNDPVSRTTVDPLAELPTAHDLECPLCGYSLRGLSPAENLSATAQGRCPECGFEFHWDELERSDRERHPYLFEVWPRRNVWSFVRTAWGGLRPKNFWTLLRPTQTPNVRRLVVYWLIVSFVVVAAVVGIGVVSDGALVWKSALDARRVTRAGFAGVNPAVLSMVLNSPRYALPPSKQFFRNVVDASELTVPRLWLSGAIVIWPLLSSLALLIFVRSLMRARIRFAHQLRCVVYSLDAYIWAVAVLPILGAIMPFVPALVSLGRFQGAWSTLALFIVFQVWIVARLDRAFRFYLNLHRPLATAIAVQSVSFLAAIALLLLSPQIQLHLSDFFL